MTRATTNGDFAMRAADKDELEAARDLLLGDLQIFNESRWRNEEVGEKRFNFFVTLVTAVAGGFIVLRTSGRSEADAFLSAWTGRASFALLVFGFQTYLRMVHRDKVTAEFMDTSDYIRRVYKKVFTRQCEQFQGYIVPEKRRREQEQENRTGKTAKNGKLLNKGLQRLKKIFRGGYTQTTGVINGILLIVTLDVWANLPWRWALLFGAMFALSLSVYASRDHHKHAQTS
jgi:hypothetical protein